MQAETWKIIKTVLLEVLNLEESERHTYLANANISTEVRAEVESLLTQERSAKDFMSVSASGFTHEFFVGDGHGENSIIGQQIGIYEIVSELGLGGMGAVYLARRRDGKFEQKVAIKMLKRELNTEKVRRNFNREKEILATLSHPNIASLMDAGTTPDGVPYLVMEYIDGEPIDRFCQGRKLPLNSRLKLFNKVCDTVAVAHRNLIVHRDLKPSNILVTSDGEPKLLDFGIAKLLDADAKDGNTVTQLGAMTPLYASPEQIKGEPVTTATDIYSLGVVLFKILTANLPYRIGKGTNGNLLKEMTETSPTLPSEVARRANHSLVDGPAQTMNSNGVAQITPSELRGDLDNIVLKALRKEPAGRYQTVEQFSADIWRFVDGLPVRARPATLSYRASKFYGRNKVSVWAAALILISLCAGVVAALSQARAARVQARIASEARAAAELETIRVREQKERAEKTSRFMQSFLNYANPHWSGASSRDEDQKDFTVREALHDVEARMDQELADAPEVRADLHYTIGEIYRTSGDSDRAFQHFRRSLELYRQVHGDEHPKVARAIYYATLFETNLQEAEPRLRQAILMMRRTEPDNVNLPHMLQSLGQQIAKGETQRRDGARLAEAEAMILEAQSIFKRTQGENSAATITTYFSLAYVALARGDLEQAEALRSEVLRRYLKTHPGSFEHIWALVYVGEVKRKLGKEAEAAILFRQALEFARKRWKANDPNFERLVSYIKRTRAATSR